MIGITKYIKAMRDYKQRNIWRWWLVVLLASVVVGACWSGIMYFSADYGSLWSFMNNGAVMGTFLALDILVINVVERFIKRRLRLYRACRGCSFGQVVLEVLRYIGILALILVGCILWIFLALDLEPLGMAVIIYSALKVVYALLKRESWHWWLTTLLVFAIIGIWYVFNNDLPGPSSWRICDNIIDTPNQWFHSYHFYWLGNVACTTSLLGGMASSIMLLAVKGIRKLRGDAELNGTPFVE